MVFQLLLLSFTTVKIVSAQKQFVRQDRLRKYPTHIFELLECERNLEKVLQQKSYKWATSDLVLVKSSLRIVI